MLKVFIERKTRKTVKVGIKFHVKDNDKKNVIFPLTEQKAELTDASDEMKVYFMFTKIEPTKDTWGDISLEINVKEAKTPALGGPGNAG